MTALRDSRSRFVSGGVVVTTINQFSKVEVAADRATFENVREAAFEIGKTARASIKTKKTSSTPGSPPHTRAGKRGIRRAIRVGMEGRERSVVGPRHSVFGTAGETLEFGGARGSTVMEARPFMGPALESNLDRFAKGFSGSIGE